jgi:recombination protein RecT
MARKTVLKLLLSKSAPLSIEMERAITTDQAIINDEKTEDITYVDNDEVEIDHEAERVRVLIEESVTQEDLDFAKGHAGEEFLPLIKSKQKELNELNKK